MNLLYAELSRWQGTPFVWGESDCALALADWVIRARGLDFDPAADVRGYYHDARSCYAVTGWLRNPVQVIEDMAAHVGLERTDEAKPGDIGVVMATTRPGMLAAFGAIKTSGVGLWAIRKESAPFAWSGTPQGVVAAWSVGYEG